MDATGLPGQRRSLGQTDNGAGARPPAADDLAESSWPADRARDPATLLDTLRQRLAQLPANHPSAWPGDEPAAVDEPADSVPGDGWSSDGEPVHGWQPSGRPESDSASGRPESDRAVPGQPERDESPADRPENGRSENGKPAGDRPTADRSRADRGNGQDEARAGPTTNGGQPGDLGGGADWLNAGQAGPAELYRPWFMSGDPDSPWFAAGPDEV